MIGSRFHHAELPGNSAAYLFHEKSLVEVPGKHRKVPSDLASVGGFGSKISMEINGNGCFPGTVDQ